MEIPTTLRVFKNLLQAGLAMLLMAFAPLAQADSCSATMSDIAFGDVSPVAGRDYYATGTLNVSCTAVPLQGNILLLPAITTCAMLGPGPGAADIQSRVLMNGARRLRFNLFRAQTYDTASVWGTDITTGSINPGFASLLAVGSGTVSTPVYARIAAADLAFASGGLAYSANFAGAGTLAWNSSTLLAVSCLTSGNIVPFSFTVTAKVVNDCLITADPVAFGSRGILAGAVRATGGLSVKCTAGSSYQIALNGGSAGGTPAARRMKNGSNGATLGYVLSASQDGPAWGDGSDGTTTYSGTGTGAAQRVPVHCLVPAQTTPPPGDYSDRVTATIYF